MSLILVSSARCQCAWVKTLFLQFLLLLVYITLIKKALHPLMLIPSLDKPDPGWDGLQALLLGAHVRGSTFSFLF